MYSKLDYNDEKTHFLLTRLDRQRGEAVDLQQSALFQAILAELLHNYSQYTKKEL